MTFAESMSKPWVYGVHDCSQFAIQCEKAVTGTTRFADMDGASKTFLHGLKIITRDGHFNVWDFVDSRLERIDPKDVRRGDWVGHTTDGKSLGVMANKGGFYCAVEQGGIILREPQQIAIAWRI